MIEPKSIASRGSVQKLEKLGFDPLEVQVYLYRKLLVEIECQEKIATKELVRLNKDGSAKAYSVDLHMSLIDRASAMVEKLTRYAYARVPETDKEGPPIAPVLNIHLTDGEGNAKKFVFNGNDDNPASYPE